MKKSNSFWDDESSAQEGLLKTEDHRFQMKVIETIELLQDACPVSQAESTFRRSLARFGEAYLFFNQTGQLCFFTDFVKSFRNDKMGYSLT